MHLSGNDGVAGLRVYTENGRSMVRRVFRVKELRVSFLRDAFNLECEANKQIAHPGLPRLFRHEVQGDRFSVDLDHNGAVNLKEHISGAVSGGTRHLDVHQALSWSRQLADAVLHLHRQRPFAVLHRELSPLSVCVIPPTLSIRLLHFGLPSSLHPRDLVAYDTRSGAEFRDPRWLEGGWSHPRADIYSFGRTLQFLLASLPQTNAGDDGDDGASRLTDILTAIAQRCVSSSEGNYESMEGVVDHLRSLNLTKQPQCTCGQTNRPSARFCAGCGASLHAGEVRVQVNASEFVYEGEGEPSLISSFRERRFVPLVRYRMMESMHTIESDPGFDELLSLANLPEIAKMQHQKDAVLRALKQMRGRALHTTVLTRDITEPLFVSLSGISSRLEARIKDQGVGVGTVCYQIFRGTWTAFQINALLDRRIPLAWLFRKTPHAVGNTVLYMHLVSHLCLVLLEEYALKRLENRQFGETTSRRVSVVEGASLTTYIAEQPLPVSSDDGCVDIPANSPFNLVPLSFQANAEIQERVRGGVDRLRRVPEGTRGVLVLPMDVLSDPALGAKSLDVLKSMKSDWLIVGQSMAQLSAEVEQKLAITAEQIDENEVDAANVDKHTD